MVDLLTVVLRRPALAGLPMLAIYSVPVAVYVDSVPVLPFIVGAVGFLWLLVADNVDRVRRFGRRFTGDGRDVDVWEPSPLAAAGRRLGRDRRGRRGAAAAGRTRPHRRPAVPADPGRRRHRQRRPAAAAAAGSTCSPRSAASSTRPRRSDLLKVTTNEPDPFYLRFGVADVLTEQGFGNRPPSGRPLDRGLPDPRDNAGAGGGTLPAVPRRRSRSPTTFEQSLRADLHRPVGVDGPGRPGRTTRTTQVVFSSRTTTKGKKYSVRLRAGGVHRRPQLRSAQPLAPDNPLRQLHTSAAGRRRSRRRSPS